MASVKGRSNIVQKKKKNHIYLYAYIYIYICIYKLNVLFEGNQLFHNYFTVTDFVLMLAN